MDFHLHGGSPSEDYRHPSDPVHYWWESISRARSRIHILSSLLPSPSSSDDEDDYVEEDPLSSLADTDSPARSLLLSSAAYSVVSAAVSSTYSGSGDDPLCQWLDTYLSSDPDFRLVVLCYLPLISAVYLRLPPSDPPPPWRSRGLSLRLRGRTLSRLLQRDQGAQWKACYDLYPRSLSAVALSLPSQSGQTSNPNSNPGRPLVGVLSPPLEPQMAVKSTKRASIVGVVLDCYYKQISHMPSWSKLDFCKFSTVWAGVECPCTSEFDHKLENENFGERVNGLYIEEGHNIIDCARIPLPWEFLQPVLRILGHCLLGPLNVDEVKDAAGLAVRRMYARASHDLIPQAILATRSLVQLGKRAREAAMAASSVAVNGHVSVNTLSKAKKPETLLVSK